MLLKTGFQHLYIRRGNSKMNPHKETIYTNGSRDFSMFAFLFFLFARVFEGKCRYCDISCLNVPIYISEK